MLEVEDSAAALRAAAGEGKSCLAPSVGGGGNINMKKSLFLLV